MSDKTTLNREEIELLLSQHTIGDGTTSICADCNGVIEEEGQVRFYATRPRGRPAWRLLRVYHAHCGGITLDQGEQTSDYEAEGTGVLVSDPEIEDNRTPPDEIKELWEDLFEVDVAVHQPGDPPQCYLEDVTLTKITSPGDRVHVFGGSEETCDSPDCELDAIGEYEGIVPPSGTIRYFACEDHAPDESALVRSLQPDHDDTDGAE